MLFCVSFVLATICAYFIVSLAKPKNFLSGFLYFVITMFAQIVFIAEFLSLFKMFQPLPFLALQVVALITIITIWVKKGKPLFKENPAPTFKRILKNLKKDKFLILLSLGWIFSVFVALFLAIIIHTTKSGDAEIYHVARSYFWVINHSIEHFQTSQVRMLAFPINSEILYAWNILFLKKATCIGLVSFTAYFVAISALFGVMNNFCYRRRLWIIFIVSAFANVIVQMSATETDIIVAGLVLSSMYLFKVGLKEQRNIPLFFASLAYALAVGTKTTAFFLIPAIAIYFIYNSFKTLKTQVWKPFCVFLGFGTLNFILFSAYNYIENFLFFGNVLGSTNTIEFHKNYNGLKGTLSTFIKTNFLLFDFTGIPGSELLIAIRNFVQNKILTALSLSHIQNGVNSTKDTLLNKTMYDTLMGAGLLGCLVFVPCLLNALVKPLIAWTKTNRDNFIFAIMFLLTVAIMSLSIVFMTYNNRFLSTFILVCAPIMGASYGYKRGFLVKLTITLVAIFYFTIVSTHLWTRPFVKIVDALFVKKQTIAQVNERVTWLLYDKNLDAMSRERTILDQLAKYPKGTKVIIFQAYNNPRCYLTQAVLEGLHLDFGVIETFNQEDLLNYDVIIYPTLGQISNVSYKKDLAPYCNYKDRHYQDLTNEDTARPCTCQCFIKDEIFDLLYENGYRTDFEILSEDEVEYLFIKKTIQK